MKTLIWGITNALMHMHNLRILAYSVKYNPIAYHILSESGAVMHIDDFNVFHDQPTNLRTSLLALFFKTVDLKQYISCAPSLCIHGFTPLHLVIMCNEPCYVTTVIKRGFSSNSSANYNSLTPTYYLLNIHIQYMITLNFAAVQSPLKSMMYTLADYQISSKYWIFFVKMVQLLALIFSCLILLTI